MTVLRAYNADGNVSSLTAVNATTGNQVTQYVYGTTLANSGLATSTLKREEIYPDSADIDDVIRFSYNRQQQVTAVTDQAGTTHTYEYDRQGRVVQDRVTSLGSGVDGAVRRIATTYEVRGMRATITSYDHPNIGSGNIVNQCQYAYNDFSQLVTEHQSHAGAVNVSTTPQVEYLYADGSANTTRPTGIVYPNGRELTYEYGSSGSIDDRCSRISEIVDDDATTLCEYGYLGRGSFVTQTSPEPDLMWTLIDLTETNDPDTGDFFVGLDRFGRVKDNRWYNFDTEEDIDRIQYGYDRAGNRIWRHNLVAASLSEEFDEIYYYDGVHRLKEMQRGTLNGGQTALTSKTFAQCWTLDSTGNWTGFREDDNGDNTWDLIQERTANGVNEITGLINTTGPAWTAPAYNRAGNMTTIPTSQTAGLDWNTLSTDEWSDLTTDEWAGLDASLTRSATYDAWNRLVKITDNDVILSDYTYDGAKRRIVQRSYTEGGLSETRHYFYTERAKWQVIEERLGTTPDSADAERQFAWGLRYIDDLIVRDRDTNADGTLDERLYACQDGNWNVTAIVDEAGVVQERYAYSAYGVPVFLTAALEATTGSVSDWESLYCGYRWEMATEVFHVRHRVVCTGLGIWLQRDPLDGQSALSLYIYVDGQPVGYVDTFGEVKVDSEGCPPNKRECIQIVADSLKAIISSQKCFSDPSSNSSCDNEISDCITAALDGITITCGDPGVGALAKAKGPCVQIKTDAINAGCKTTCLGRHEYTDPGCGPCPGWAMDQSSVVIGGGSKSSGHYRGSRDIGPSWCTNAANRKQLAMQLIHEMGHHCVGAHWSGDSGRDRPRDRCGRPSVYTLMSEFNRRCGS